MFFSTLVVVAIITITLLRWIDQLGRFGRVGDTIRRIEKAALPAFVSAAKAPGLGTSAYDTLPDGLTPIYAEDVGCITHIDVLRLERIAEEGKVQIYLSALPGTLVDPALAILHVPAGALDEETVERVRDCITVDRGREFDQDPRFGLVVLSEIASRAMSPAVNDPGTAIEVLGSVLRVMLTYSSELSDPDEPRCASVYAPRLDPLDLLEIVVNPIARDAAGNLEVLTRMLRILAALRDTDPALYTAAARTCAARLLEFGVRR